MDWVYLSHLLTPETPSYGGRKPLKIESISRIAHGDSSNSSQWTLSSHLGTHLETSRHFFEDGQTVDELAPQSFHFIDPLLVECPMRDSELITVEHLKPLLRDSGSPIDLLLVKTSFEKRRGEKEYWEQNPGFHPEVGTWLRKEFSALRAVGIDTLSISSWQNREMGREAHRSFLDPQGPGEPLMIIEDISLCPIGHRSLVEVWALPTRVLQTEGAPCTIIGRIE